MWTAGQAVTKEQNVAEADILFEKVDNTKKYNKYLQTYITAVHKNRAMNFRLPNPRIYQHFSRKQNIGFSVVLSSSFVICLWKGKQLIGALINNLIMAGEIALLST
jgi:hypothetical protein